MLSKYLFRLIIMISLSCVWIYSTAVLAKGLDELTPDPEKAIATPPPGADSTGSGAIVETPPPPPSQMSMALASRVFLGTGFGFTTLSGDKGDWAAGGSSEIVAGYLTDAHVMGFRMGLTYRYQPIDFTVNRENRSYRGVVEGHHFGTKWLLPQGELTYVAQSELGAMLCKVDPLDNMETEDELEGMGVNVTIGGGVDYQLFEKVQVGGRIMVGVGTFSVVQLATSASFMF